MAFERPRNQKVRKRPGVSVSVSSLNGKGATTTRIGLGEEAQAALGLNADSRVELLCGTDDDAGTILLRKSRDGLKPIQTGRQIFVMSTQIPGRSKKFPVVTCRYEQANGGLVVTLPPEHGGPAANVAQIKHRPA